MAIIKNLTGKRYGRLVALRPTEERSTRGEVIWEFICDCGNIVKTRGTKATSGTTQSCGCLAKEIARERMKETQSIDVAGRRFGRLVAIKRTGETNTEGNIWECKCDCGGEIRTTTRNLIGGRTTSCGCKGLEQITMLGKSNKGKSNPAYNHKITNEERESSKFQRVSARAKELRAEAYRRDEYKCRVCGSKSRDLVAHHLEGFANNPDKRFEIDNLITLCEKCHIEFHKTYGYKNNTKKQFEEYLRAKVELIHGVMSS